MRKCVFEHMQRMPRSACASAQSDQGLRCPQTESLGIKDCFSGGQYPDETDDVNPHILRMLKKLFARRGQSITV